MKTWKNVAMIMLAGLLTAGPIVATPAFADKMNSEDVHTALAAAQAAQDKAAKDLHQAMASMDSMKAMPMTANEKHMMQMVGQMADTIKDLTEANKRLLEAVKALQKQGAGSK